MARKGDPFGWMYASQSSSEEEDEYAEDSASAFDGGNFGWMYETKKEREDKTQKKIDADEKKKQEEKDKKKKGENWWDRIDDVATLSAKRVGTGVVQGISGLGDLVGSSEGTSELSKRADRVAKGLDEEAKKRDIEGAYKTANVVGEIGTYAIPGVAIAKGLTTVGKAGKIVDKVNDGLGKVSDVIEKGGRVGEIVSKGTRKGLTAENALVDTAITAKTIGEDASRGEDISLGRVAGDFAMNAGGVVAGGLVGEGLSKINKLRNPDEVLNARGRNAPSEFDATPEELDDVMKGMDAEDSFKADLSRAIDPATGKPIDTIPAARQLGTGREYKEQRLAEINEIRRIVNEGGVDATKFGPALPGMDDLGTKPVFTPDIEAKAQMDEIGSKLDQETAAIDDEIATIEAQRAESTLDGPAAKEASMNSQMELEQALKTISERTDIAPELQVVLVRQAQEAHKQELLAIVNKFQSTPTLNKTFDDAIAEAETRKMEVTARYEDELSDIQTRSAEMQQARTEAIRTMTPEQLRQMNRDAVKLQHDLDELDYREALNATGGDPDAMKQAMKENPGVANAAETDLRESITRVTDGNPEYHPGLIAGTLTTIEKVMERGGVGRVWDKVVDGQHKKGFAMGQDMEQLERLAKGIGGNKERATKIFNALEAEDFSKLDKPEREAAEWFKANFARLATELGLPKEAQISGYVTHLFDGKASDKMVEALRKIESGDYVSDAMKEKYKGNPKKLAQLASAGEKRARNTIFQADPELLRLMRRNANGKITNKYLDEKRTGVEGYETDPFNAFRVYAERAYSRKYLEPPLKQLAESKANVSKSMQNYINDEINRIKKVPGEEKKYQELINNSLDKFSAVIERLTLGKVKADSAAFERGTAATAKQIYRGTLQFNPGTAVTNFTQMANTFGEIGSRWMGVGVKETMAAMKSKDFSELHRMGILENTYTDALVNDTKILRGKVGKAGAASDKVGWYMFQKVEEMNRATAYYGAKAKGLAKGMSTKEAEDYGAKIARKTQFKFSEFDTPPALQGPIAKNFSQLLTFSVKQAEYLKNAGLDEFLIPLGKGEYRMAAEGFMRVSRIITGYAIMGGTIGQITGVGAFDWEEILDGDTSSLKNTVKDNIPFAQNFADGNMPTSPLVSFLAGSDRGIGVANVIRGRDQYGTATDKGELATELLTKKVPSLFLPGGAQANKMVGSFPEAINGIAGDGEFGGGIGASQRGYSETDTGKVRFGVEGTFDKIRGSIFGQYNTEGGRDYVERLEKKGGSNAEFSSVETEMYKNASPARRAMYEAFFNANDELPSADKTGQDIEKAVKEGGINKGKRLAAEYNAQVDATFAPIVEKYNGMVPKELLEYIEDQKVSPYEKDLTRRIKN